MTDPAYTIEKNFAVPADKLWQAITDPDQMRQWYFDLPGFRAEPGYDFQFEGGPEDRKYLHRCRVIEAIPEKKLSYTWRYEGYAGESLVSFELFPIDQASTKLRLTHEGLETFPAENPDFAASNFAEGWKHIIGKSLHDFLEGDAKK